MSLFYVHHRHDAHTCPAKDPVQGSMLLAHISPINAQKYGVDLHGEAVIDNQHTFVLIVEAENKANVEDFMQPIMQAGEVEIYSASRCEIVVEREGC